MYLLDTNVFIRFANKSSVKVVDRVLSESPSRLYLSSISRGELMYGAYKSRRVEENIANYYNLFAFFENADFDNACADEYGRIRAYLQMRGAEIGANDMFISAIALANDFTLVTANTRDFERIPRLRIENWEV